MVHPDHRRRGIFTALFHAAHAHAMARGIQRLFFMVERSSAPGRAFVASVGASAHHSEYLMTLARQQPIQTKHPHLELQLATTADAPAMVRILAAAFPEREEDPAHFAAERLRNPLSRWYVARDAGAVLATIGLHLSDATAFIYGFAVAPAHQGRGYGRQILGQIVALALADQPRRVLLEVETQNEHALSLYIACGFQQTTVYDYYQKDTALGG